MTNANDPINPHRYTEYKEDDGDFYSIEMVETGLTKREYFAAMAMQGLLADENNHGHIELIALDAVRFTDALINALNQKP